MSGTESTVEVESGHGQTDATHNAEQQQGNVDANQTQQVRESNRTQGLEDSATGNPNRGESSTNGKRAHSDGVGGEIVHEDDEPIIKKSRYDDFVVKKIIREEDEGKWTLPESLALHFVTHTKTHISDLDMK